MNYAQGNTYESIQSIELGEYVNCTFKSCDLSKSSFAGFEFEDCEFEDCNLSNCQWADGKMQNVRFSNCKMLGNSFEGVKSFLLELYFDGCVLSMSSFYALPLKESTFIQCNLSECEFSDSDLSGAKFNRSQLVGATFSNSVLEGADLREAVGYSIHPAENKIRKAKFSESGIRGLLDQFNIEIE